MTDKENKQKALEILTDDGINEASNTVCNEEKVSSDSEQEVEFEKEEATDSKEESAIDNSSVLSENTKSEDEDLSEEHDEKESDILTPDGMETEQLSLFSISVSDSNETSDAADAESTDGIEDSEETILSPDEIFKNLNIESDEKDDIPEENEEELDSDGQYRIHSLIPLKSEDENCDTEEELPEDKEYEEEKEESEEKYNPEKPRRMDGRFDFVELFVFTLVAVMILTTFFFRHSVVKGESMEGTLKEGEHLIISKFLYTPKRGDIIVCQDYDTGLHEPIVKRIIAIEGDSVKVVYEDGKNRVYVNGELIEEDYVYIDDPRYEYPPYPYSIVEEVPKGEVYVMGDHRNDSADSRMLGTVSEESILGRVLVRFYPFNRFGKVK